VLRKSDCKSDWVSLAPLHLPAMPGPASRAEGISNGTGGSKGPCPPFPIPKDRGPASCVDSPRAERVDKTQGRSGIPWAEKRPTARYRPSVAIQTRSPTAGQHVTFCIIMTLCHAGDQLRVGPYAQKALCQATIFPRAAIAGFIDQPRYRPYAPSHGLMSALSSTTACGCESVLHGRNN
jgi:hypothetical protein